jgi:hypothetical protein
MNQQPLLTIIVSALSDFVISAGGCMTTAMVATGSTTMPSTAVLVFSGVTGAIAAARGVRALLTPPPTKGP